MLDRLQRDFWRLISAPTGVARAREPGEEVSSWVVGQDEAEAVRRLDVYADMYFYRLLDVLAEDYRKTAALVGAPAFHNLVTDYLLAHPSVYPSVRQVGTDFWRFVGSHPLQDRHPPLADLARLEWARLEVYDCEDPRPLPRDRLIALPPERWLGLSLQLVPHVLLSLAYPAHRCWHGEAVVDAEATDLLVWRRDLTVFHRVLPSGEHAAIAALASGETFEVVCAGVEAASQEEAARVALGYLERWLADGVLSDFPTQAA